MSCTPDAIKIILGTNGEVGERDGVSSDPTFSLVKGVACRVGCRRGGCCAHQCVFRRECGCDFKNIVPELAEEWSGLSAWAGQEASGEV